MAWKPERVRSCCSSEERRPTSGEDDSNRERSATGDACGLCSGDCIRGETGIGSEGRTGEGAGSSGSSSKEPGAESMYGLSRFVDDSKLPVGGVSVT